MATSPFEPIPIIPATAECRAAIKTGRLTGHWVEAGTETFICWSLYGWTGADQDNEAAQRTDDLVQICAEEQQALGNPMAIFACDLNACTARIPALQALLDDEMWMDCGAHASNW